MANRTTLISLVDKTGVVLELGKIGDCLYIHIDEPDNERVYGQAIWLDKENLKILYEELTEHVR